MVDGGRSGASREAIGSMGGPEKPMGECTTVWYGHAAIRYGYGTNVYGTYGTYGNHAYASESDTTRYAGGAGGITVCANCCTRSITDVTGV